MASAERKTETILVVEDEPVVLEMVKSILQGNGYTVLAAPNGKEALQVGESHTGSIDLVLTDIIMPGMSGGEFIQRLMPVHPGIRVLYMSGYTKYAVVDHGVLESVNSFIWKPFSPADLLLKVRETLDNPPETTQ